PAGPAAPQGPRARRHHAEGPGRPAAHPPPRGRQGGLLLRRPREGEEDRAEAARRLRGEVGAAAHRLRAVLPARAVEEAREGRPLRARARDGRGRRGDGPRPGRGPVERLKRAGRPRSRWVFAASGLVVAIAGALVVASLSRADDAKKPSDDKRRDAAVAPVPSAAPGDRVL